MLGGVIRSTPSAAHEPSKRRTVDDRATSLLAHLAQLELHASPDTTEIDGHHSVIVFPGSISGLRNNILNAGIVVGRIQPAESGDGLLNHCFHLSVISDVAMDSECLVTVGRQFLGCRLHCLLIPVRQRHRRT